MENTNKETITIKNGDATISVPKNTEGFMDMVTTQMSVALGEVVLVAAHGYCFESNGWYGHTVYVSSQEEVDKLLKQIRQCDCQECSDFRMQSDIRERMKNRRI